MHVGSKYAVRSPEAQLEDGTELKMTPFNEQMYENWCETKDKLEQKPTLLILNGEPIDGSGIKTVGSDVWTTSVNAQLDDAERLLRLYDWEKILLTRGSRYHVAVQNMFHEEVLAERLGATPYAGTFGNKKQYTDFYLWFRVDDKRFSVCHHVGYNKTELYRTTNLGREAAVMEFAEGKWYPKGGNIDVIVRSHVHYYCQVRFRNSITFTTPCWKLPDEFQMRRGLGGTAVDIGSVEVIVEPEGKIDIYEHLVGPNKYPLPQELAF